MLRNISSAATNRKEKMEKALKLKSTTPAKSDVEDEEIKDGE